MARATTDYPLVLFPLKIETRFIGDQLWIRVFPDVPFLQSHDPHLSKDEIAAAKMFRQITDAERPAEWDLLVAKFGVYRASFLVQMSEINLNQQDANSKKREESAPDFYFKWLPDNLHFYLYKKGDPLPAYTQRGQLIKAEGLLLLEGEDDWLENFAKAEVIGMATKIKLENKESGFEKLIVSGFRNASEKMESATGLAHLFHNHQYTEGFSFLEYNTPTNNTEFAKSGFSAQDEFDAAKSFGYSVEGLNLKTTPLPNTGLQTQKAGTQLSKILGFDANHLQHVQNADISAPPLNELYQKASWFALGAQSLFMLFGNTIGVETQEALWEHYSKYVKARGNYPALKIGNQPYGVLPVMSISNATKDIDLQNSDALSDKMLLVLAQLKKRWLTMAENGFTVPRVGDGQDSYLEILKILSLQEGSSFYQIRALEYHDFQRHFDQWLKQTAATVSAPISGALKTDYEWSKSRLDLFRALLVPTEPSNLEAGFLNKYLAHSEDQLIQAPLMNLRYGNHRLLKFDEDQAALATSQGVLIPEEKTEAEAAATSPDGFDLVDVDLKKFDDFLIRLSANDGTKLTPYEKDLSLFVDLFLRSYENASQLYHRTIPFEPGAGELKGHLHFHLGEIKILAGQKIKKGQIAVTIIKKKTAADANPKTINIKAPFSGLIEKYHFKTGAPIKTGSPLFTLVNKAKHEKIKKTFIALGQQIVKASNAIADENDRKKALEKALGEAIDLNSYRLDAWITSLAARRIDELRNQPDHEKGIYFGAYGWVENLLKDDHPVAEATMTDIYREAGGIIHTPGSAQAVASSLFKNSFLSHQNESENESNPFALNLSSDRLQKSQVLLEGIRQGQQPEALLGYQLERYIHEAPVEMHSLIYELRSAYPLYENSSSANGLSNGFVNLSVVDGLKVIENKDKLKLNLDQRKSALLQTYIARLEDMMDSSLDTLFYEAGYQITQGNLSHAAAALDATKGEIEPPITEAIKTRLPGTGITHKLILLFPPSNKTYDPIQNSRAAIQPILENWLANHLGPLNKIGCQVELLDAKTDQLNQMVAVRLSDLKIGYLDFLYLSADEVSDSNSELEMRIREVVKNQTGAKDEDTKYLITNAAPKGCQSLEQALEVARYTYSLLSKCRYLKSDDLSTEGETIQYDRAALLALKQDLLAPILNHLKTFVKSDTPANVLQPEALAFLSKMDFEDAKRGLFDSASLDGETLKMEINKKIQHVEKLLNQFNETLLYYTAFELLEQAIKILFGKPFIVLPPASLSQNFTKVIKNKNQERLVGLAADSSPEQVWGQERIENWVQGVAQVAENTERFEDWLMVDAVWKATHNISTPYEYHIVQGPTLEQYPWAALSKKEIDALVEKHYTSATIYKDPKSEKPFPIDGEDYYPDDCDSTVIYAPGTLNLAAQNGFNNCVGIVIEEFTEQVPDKKVKTGLSFHYNAPNSEAPQSILLAVHSKTNFPWEEEDLRDIIKDTMDLYKIRMVDLEALEKYDYLLPMTYWFNIPKVK